MGRFENPKAYGTASAGIADDFGQKWCGFGS